MRNIDIEALIEAVGTDAIVGVGDEFFTFDEEPERLLTLDDLSRTQKAAYEKSISEAAFSNHVSAVNLEVQRRIFGHASANTQMNMTAAKAAGMLNAAQEQAYRNGLLWIAAVRAQGKIIAMNPELDPLDDNNWPKVPPEAAALAKDF
ncbi:MAG: hypothetical protein AAFQ32_04615 [Pseudomonadota bacterium]